MLPRILLIIFFFCQLMNSSAQEKFKDPYSDLWGLKKGDSIILPAEYNKIKQWKVTGSCACSREAFLIKKYSLWGIADLNGKILLPPSYDDIGDQCQNGCLIKVTRGKSVGYINDSFRLVVPLKYYSRDLVAGNCILVNENDSCSLIDKSGNAVIGKRKGFLTMLSDSTGKYFFYKGDSVSALFDISGKTTIGYESKPEKTYYSYIIGIRNGKYGVFSLSGKEHIPFLYEKLEPHQLTWYYRYYVSGKWGLMKLSGEKVCEAKYDSLLRSDFNHVYYGFMNNGKYGAGKFSGKEIIPALYESKIDPEQLENKKYALVKLNGKIGMLDTNGKQMIPFKYDEITEPESPSEDSLLRMVVNGKEGRMRFNGSVTVKPEYDLLTRSIFYPNYYFAVKNGLHGIITKTGRVTVPCMYEEFTFREDHRGSYKVRLNGEEGFINVNGHYKLKDAERTRALRVTHSSWRNYSPWDPELQLVRIPPIDLRDSLPDSLLTKNTAIKKDTLKDIPPAVDPDIIELLPSFKKYEVITAMGLNYGIKKVSGKELIPAVYSDYHAGRYAFVMSGNNAVSVFDTTGKLKARFLSSEIKEFDSLQMVLKTAGKFQVCDIKGRVIIPPVFSDIRRITDSLYLVQSGTLYGLYNRKGLQVLPVVYPAIYRAENLVIAGLNESQSAGYLIVRSNSPERPNQRLYGLAGPGGKLLVKPKFTQIMFLAETPTEFYLNENWYRLDANGTMLAPVNVNSRDVKNKYSSLRIVDWADNYYFNQRYFIAAKNGKSGILSLYDSIIVPFVFDTIHQYNEKNLVFGKNGKWGLADGKGNIVIDAVFDSIISRNVLLWDSASPCNSQYTCEKMQFVIVRKSGLYGVYDISGKEIVAPVYDDFRFQRESFTDPVSKKTEKLPSSIFRKNGKWFVVDVNGREFEKPGVFMRNKSQYYGGFPAWEKSR